MSTQLNCKYVAVHVRDIPTGPALDWAVATCILNTQTVAKYVIYMRTYDNKPSVPHWGESGCSQTFRPSTDWTHGGLIIDLEDITVGPWDTSPAAAHYGLPRTIGATNPRMVGPDKLTAAMRCFVFRNRSALNGNVDGVVMLPEYLL